MDKSKIIIQMPTNKTADNFNEWFKKEGFLAFMKSKSNKLTKHTDNFITCLSEDEKTEYGYYYELE